MFKILNSIAAVVAGAGAFALACNGFGCTVLRLLLRLLSTVCVLAVCYSKTGGRHLNQKKCQAQSAASPAKAMKAMKKSAMKRCAMKAAVPAKATKGRRRR